jgi:transposase
MATNARRKLLIALGGMAAAWPIVARAQQGERMRRIVLMPLGADDPEGQRRLAAFQQELQQLGWNDHNLRIETRWPAGEGFWLHRVLEAHGVHKHVLDPASLQVNRHARRPKTHRIDADRMVRHLRGEPEACSVFRVPSPEQEDPRRLHRERDHLIAERVAHVNRVKGLCATQGIYDYEPLRRDRLKRLENLRSGDGRALTNVANPVKGSPCLQCRTVSFSRQTRGASYEAGPSKAVAGRLEASVA